MVTNESTESNTLYYGDNLDILRRYVGDESIDLVYLDPPFNSARNYNVLFAEQDGTRAAAQIRVFEDTWQWDAAAASAFEMTVESGGPVAEAMRAFRVFLGDSDMLAYLSMMAPRLVELRRVMKSTGSLYLHCDPTAAAYLKLLLDGVFGPQQFRNEIVWKRTSAHSDPNRYGANIDTILYYTKSDEWTWNQAYVPYDEGYAARFRNSDPDGRLWMDDNLTAKGLSGGGYEYEYKGAHSLWRMPVETMERLDAEGRLHFTKTGGIRLKRYLDEAKGFPIQALWEDINPINSQAGERLGYPTQKPVALLERIIAVSSNAGDVVLDPFCGCGTTIAASQHLKRRWLGIDITHLAINLIRTRLRDTYGDSVKFDVIGEPTTVDDAEELAKTDQYQFQWWALGLVGARPVEQKKGADKGIDGRLYFHESGKAGRATKQVIFSVKAGHVTSSHVRDLVGVLTREKAEIGVLISFDEPTRDMRKEAASAGFYESPWGKHPKVQLLTVGELLHGKMVDMPRTAGTNRTFKTAPKAKRKKEAHPELFGGAE
jgi:DNA modification methylase